MQVYDESTINKLYKLKDKAKKLVGISKLFYRDNNCVENCAGCCMKFSLVYWGDRWEKFKQVNPEEVKNFISVDFNGVTVWEDKQLTNKDYFCKHLDKSNGRCKIHFKVKPLHCEMEPIAFSDGLIVKRPFKEAHLMKTLEGFGAPCYMTEIDKETRVDELMLLRELNEILKEENLDKIINKELEYGTNK